jgi:multidrug efflux pump
MNLPALFIRRPVATILLTIGISLTGIAAFFVLPIAALPSVDFPTIAVQANMAGASPQVMATSVATPLERRLGTISNVTEMTSRSGTGQTQVTLQFGLNRDIDGAARDVQAAINAARGDLPTALRSNPTYRKFNPADAPIMVLNLTSQTLTNPQIYDAAVTILQQKLSQVSGVGQVDIGGGAAPAVRIEVNPRALSQYGISSEDVRAAIAAANANLPKGTIQPGDRRLQIYTNDQGKKATDYAPLVIAYRNGAPVRLQDVANVYDGSENARNLGLVNGRPALIVQVMREPDANIISTVDNIKALLPELRASLPNNVDLNISVDRTGTIRASLHEVERTLVIAIALVVLVVLVFLRNGRATLIPAVAVVVSLLGTLGIMYVLGFSLNNLSLMALTVATGFVVDDAIVVLENITRHVEEGMPRFKAALLGSREVAFTVVSMSISLIAVFIPILFMADIVGRLFREFALTLSAAVLFSLLLSLTATPMMASRLIDRRKVTPVLAGPSLKSRVSVGLGRLSDWIGRRLDDVLRTYEESLNWALNHKRIIILLLFATIALNGFLYVKVQKGFFPTQDTGVLNGRVQVDDSSSFDLTSQKVLRLQQIVKSDPAVDTVSGFTQGAGGFMFVSLKPLKERKISSEQVIQRLRPKLSSIPGAQVFLQSVQDVRVGGRQSNASYQYTLQSDDLNLLRTWGPRLTEQLKRYPALTDVNSDQQERGLESYVTVDRETASRLGITPQQVNNALYNSFGQRQVATIFNPLNQYRIVMQVMPEFARDPSALDEVNVSPATGANTAGGAGVLRTTTGGGAAGQAQTGQAVSTTIKTMTPLSTFASYGLAATPSSVNHQGSSVSATLSFNLAPGASLSEAEAAVNDAKDAIGMPASVVGQFSGTAQAFQKTLSQQLILIGAALIAVYVVLGILYESYIHPITVLSTLPSAGVGAVAALMLFRVEFSIIALIGVILLIGIVKKNAIMIIDFALQGQRVGMSARDAIHRACLLRFRPILMTTMAAILGALPLAVGLGEGGELRRPLGIAIIGGLVASQMLTLLTTPVVYVYLDRLNSKRRKPRWAPDAPGRGPAAGPALGHAAPPKD